MFSIDARRVLIGIFENNCNAVINALENSDYLIELFNKVMSKGIQVRITHKDVNPQYDPSTKTITLPDNLVKDIRSANLIDGDITSIANQITKFASFLAHESVHADFATGRTRKKS